MKSNLPLIATARGIWVSEIFTLSKAQHYYYYYTTNYYY